ncbi:flavin-containing monooxygenase 5-like isoform X2 [Amphiura filiformis]
MSRKRVAIIGAGASGLTAIKCCLDEGLEPVCFEKTNEIGGLWCYRESNEERDGLACVFKSTVINTSKEMMCYSDFPIPKEFPNFMHNRYVNRYFHLYADAFDLRKYIKTYTMVKMVTPADDFESSGCWRADIMDRASNKEWTEIFDAVLVCNGHHTYPYIPEFEGVKDFEGTVIHTHDYKRPAGYEDKRVLVIGVGNSGCDAAVELSRTAEQVFLSTRNGTWVLNRLQDHGIPADLVGVRRMWDLVPYGLRQAEFERRLNQQVDLEKYALKPKHHIFAAHPTVNDELPNRIANGTVKVKCNVKCFTKTGVEFEDGTTEEIDCVVLATGYTFSFPMVDPNVVHVDKNQVSLYKNVFPANQKHPTLAIIGLAQPWGAINPISEIQCRWATRVFKGTTLLPSKDKMLDYINTNKEDMKKRYVSSQRHTIQVDFITYMDEIASEFGVKPEFKKVFAQDPVLAFRCFFGPCYPYQYRLIGPGKWDGAKQAIETAWGRMLAAFDTRKVPVQETSSLGFWLKILVVIVVILGVWWTFI